MSTRLIFLAAAREGRSSYLIAGDSGAIAARGTWPDVSGIAAARTVLVVPGADVLARWIVLPAGRPVQASAAASAALKNEIAVSPERLHIALAAPEADGLRLVCAIDWARMQSFLDRAAELGITPDAVVPDFLLVPVPDDDAVHAVALGDIVAVRGRRLAFTTEPNLLPLVLGDRPLRRLDEKDADAVFAAGARQLPIDLLQQAFAPNGEEGSWRAFRRAGALAAALLLSPLLLWGAETARFGTAARALHAEADAKALSVIPAGGAGDPILRLDGRLAELRAGHGFLRSTAVLFDAVSKIKGAELENFSYLQEGPIQATLIGSSPSDMTAIARALEAEGFVVEADAVANANGRISTRIILRPRP